MTQIKLTIYGLIVLAIVIIAGLIYWRGSSNATTKSDLRVAREVIKTERETLKVTNAIDMRVNAEYTQTVQTAQEATREIDSIRSAAPRVPAAQPAGTGDLAHSGGGLDAGDARIVQLAREARAAARASSAKLQPADRGAR